jgi:hypothetical protein
MRKFIFPLIVVLVAVLITCRNSEEKSKEDPATQEELLVEEEVHHRDDELRLNNGEKWQANPETTEGILAMKEHLEAFRHLGIADYNQLRIHLETEFKMIFEKCTMKGEAHNQLHNYLYPMRDCFLDLSKGTETAEKAFLALEEYVPVYFDYFE